MCCVIAEIWTNSHKTQSVPGSLTSPMEFAMAINQEIIQLFTTSTNISTEHYLDFWIPVGNRVCK